MGSLARGDLAAHPHPRDRPAGLRGALLCARRLAADRAAARRGPGAPFGVDAAATAARRAAAREPADRPSPSPSSAPSASSAWSARMSRGCWSARTTASSCRPRRCAARCCSPLASVGRASCWCPACSSRSASSPRWSACRSSCCWCWAGAAWRDAPPSCVRISRSAMARRAVIDAAQPGAAAARHPHRAGRAERGGQVHPAARHRRAGARARGRALGGDRPARAHDPSGARHLAYMPQDLPGAAALTVIESSWSARCAPRLGAARRAARMRRRAPSRCWSASASPAWRCAP